MKTKEEVRKSRGQGVEESRRASQEPTDAPTAVGVVAVRFSTPRLLDSSTPLSVEQSENVYENKGSVLEKSFFMQERRDNAEGTVSRFFRDANMSFLWPLRHPPRKLNHGTKRECL